MPCTLSLFALYPLALGTVASFCRLNVPLDHCCSAAIPQILWLEHDLDSKLIQNIKLQSYKVTIQANGFFIQ